MNNLLLLVSIGVIVGAATKLILVRIEQFKDTNVDFFGVLGENDKRLATQANSVLDNIDYLKKDILELRRDTKRIKLSKPNKK